MGMIQGSDIFPSHPGTQHPTIGKLVALSKSESVIEVTGTSGILRCHFPRLNFSVMPANVS